MTGISKYKKTPRHQSRSACLHACLPEIVGFVSPKAKIKAMCDHCLPRFPLLSFSVTKFHQMLIPSNCRPRHESIPNFCLFTRLTPSYPSYSDCSFVKNGCIRSNFNRSPFILGSEDNEFSAELGFKENDENPFSLQKKRREVDQTGGVDKSSGSNIKECVKPDNLIPVEGTEGDDISKKAMGIGKLGFRRGKQVLRRSSFLAKQVISITSALSLGFVSQLWVDSTRVSFDSPISLRRVSCLLARA